ncbi:flavoprotein [Yinghuangia aomiensis]|uniref:flavoprotein n=1 Tax=Yinghuangia aomiensis TaxID=676205 RepID=UPI0031F0229E
MAVLYVVAGAAPPVASLRRAVPALVDAGWDVCVTLTPTAASWLADDPAALSAVCGRPVRTRERRLGEDRPFPAADACLAAPLTFNTLNKWASGISDNVALGTLHEALGTGVPVVAAPCFNDALARHPQVARSVGTLRGAGVRLVGDAGRADAADGVAWWDVVLAAFDGRGC